MTPSLLHRLAQTAAFLPLLLVASCGGGSVVSQFAPARVLAVGDGAADLGQDGARYTINDGTVTNWSQYLAEAYGSTLSASSAGGLSYAVGQARVSAHPDAAGNAETATITEQVDTLLAATTLTTSDLVIVNGGTSDLIAEAQGVIAGSQTQAEMLAHLSTEGAALGAQVHRLVSAGANHVLIVNPYNLGISAWAQQVDQASLLEAASSRFNESLLLSLADLGASALYVDAAYYFNLVAASPSSYSLSNVADVACTSTDSGAGIGTGTGQVNSRLCTSDTLAAGIDPSVYLFADRVYFTPVAQRLFGNYVYGRMTDRW